MEHLIGFCAAASNTGKTTLLLRVLEELKRRGVSAAVLKHGKYLSDEGKDSNRYFSAGAVGSLFVAPQGWVAECHPESELPLPRAVSLLRELTGAEVILVEGCKRERFPKIAVCRRAVTLALPCPEEELSAVVTDTPLNCALPQFGFDEVEKLCEFMMKLSM